MHFGTTGRILHILECPAWFDLLLTLSFRITIHNASWDYEGSEPRHGTRVTSLAEAPYFDANAPTRREALGFA